MKINLPLGEDGILAACLTFNDAEGDFLKHALKIKNAQEEDRSRHVAM